MNLRRVDDHLESWVHAIGSSAGMLLSIWSDPVGVNHDQHHMLSWWRLEKGKHCLHQWNPWCILDMGVSKSPARIFWQKDSGACPPLGTHLQARCSLHTRPRGCLEALCIEALGLTNKQPKKMFKSSLPFLSEDWNPFSSPRWRS
jgi:hypothetical protein